MSAEIVHLDNYRSRDAREVFLEIMGEKFEFTDMANRPAPMEEIVDAIMSDLWQRGFLIQPVEIAPRGGDVA